MSAVDSVAVFQKRATDLGIGSLIPLMEKNLWTTYASFAFAVTMGATGHFTPEEFRSNVLVPLFALADDATPPRRLASFAACFLKARRSTSRT